MLPAPAEPMAIAAPPKAAVDTAAAAGKKMRGGTAARRGRRRLGAPATLSHIVVTAAPTPATPTAQTTATDFCYGSGARPAHPAQRPRSTTSKPSRAARASA